MKCIIAYTRQQKKRRGAKDTKPIYLYCCEYSTYVPITYCSSIKKHIRTEDCQILNTRTRIFKKRSHSIAGFGFTSITSFICLQNHNGRLPILFLIISIVGVADRGFAYISNQRGGDVKQNLTICKQAGLF